MQKYDIKIPRGRQGVRIIRARQAGPVDPFEFEDFSPKPAEAEQETPAAPPPEPDRDMVAREQVEGELKAAYDRGFNDGKDVAGGMLEREMQQREEWLRRFDEIAAQLHTEFRRELNGIDQSTVALAVKIAEHVLGHEISKSAYDILEQARRALQAAHGADEVTIRVHPDDFEALETAKSTLLDEHSALRAITVLADRNVRPAGCVLETPIGKIDAQIHTQLEQLGEDLQRAAGEAGRHPELLDDPEEESADED